MQFAAKEEAQFQIHFTTTQLLADEIWSVGGNCPDVAEPATVSVVDFAHLADIEVFLTDYAYTADRRVCIVNSDEAPPAFWRAYER